MLGHPLAIDLFCGLGGWTEGLIDEGYRVIGFDNERHRYPAREFSLAEESGKGMSGKNHNGTTLIGAAREQVHGYHRAPLTGEWQEYPAQLVIQDVLTIHGRQFKDAALIVASPPCQAYSYRAMPWKRAKALPPPDNSLFEACFRIQREAMEATQWTCRTCSGEAVTRGGCRCESCDGRGWVGRHIPLVVENVRGAQKYVGRAKWNCGSMYLWGDVPALMPSVRHVKEPVDPRNRKKSGGWFYDNYDTSHRRWSSKSKQRKEWSARIAKIPYELARHIGRSWKPREVA